MCLKLLFCCICFEKASWMGIRSPIPYRWRKMKGKKVQEKGMNFANGGTGVFDTLVDAPNMTTQINHFQQVLGDKLYSKSDVKSSIALVSLAGNDYITYLSGNGSLEVRESYAPIVHVPTNLVRICPT